MIPVSCLMASVPILLASDFSVRERNFHILFYCSTICERKQRTHTKPPHWNITRPSLFVQGFWNLFLRRARDRRLESMYTQMQIRFTHGHVCNFSSVMTVVESNVCIKHLRAIAWIAIIFDGPYSPHRKSLMKFGPIPHSKHQFHISAHFYCNAILCTRINHMLMDNFTWNLNMIYAIWRIFRCVLLKKVFPRIFCCGKCLNWKKNIKIFINYVENSLSFQIFNVKTWNPEWSSRHPARQILFCDNNKAILRNK